MKTIPADLIKDLKQVKQIINKWDHIIKNYPTYIDEISLSTRSKTALLRRNITNLEQLQEFTLQEFSLWYMVGPETIKEVSEALIACGIWFKEDIQ